MKTQNPNCDSSHCRNETGEVRLLPMGGDSNAILCRDCYVHEIAYRIDRNQELATDCQFGLPTWISLKVYGQEEESAI